MTAPKMMVNEQLTSDKGQATILMVMALMTMAVITIVLAQGGRQAGLKVRTQIAADAAALASASEQDAVSARQAAQELAKANNNASIAAFDYEVASGGTISTSVAVELEGQYRSATAAAVPIWQSLIPNGN